MADSIAGHCLCNAVTVHLEGPADTIEICQCEMCRRWGGAFYPALTGEGFTVSGDDSITRYRSSAWGERAFCRSCGSNIWWRFLPTGNRSFSAGLFDATRALAVEKEIFVDEGAEWCRIRGGHPRRTGAEVIAEAKKAGLSFD